jgi:uroporphyrinogen-III synthase
MCTDAGLPAIVAPAFAFEALSPDFDPDAIWKMPQKRHLAVFTSPRSVRYGLNWIEPDQLTGASLAAVGPATARALSESGHPPDVVPDKGYSSEALLAHGSLDRAPGEAVIFAAPGGREALMRGLAEKGWQVRVFEVYSRVMLPPGRQLNAAIEATRLPLSIWTSASALYWFADNLDEAAWQKLLRRPMLVISRRLAAVAKSAGAIQVIVTDGPSNKAILAGILDVSRR